jgi:flagellar biosynthesis protein FlhG
MSAHAFPGSQQLPKSPASMLRRPVVVDQAASLRAMVESQPRAQVLAVTSGKGGVGKSNVAVNLSILLARAGKRVVLLDADLGLANADVLCNVEVRANLAHVVSRQRELSEVLIDAPGGFRLIGGASGLAKMADLSDFDRDRLIAALRELELQADTIIIDTGAGISPNVLCFTRAADHVLVVTTPEPTAITDAYAAIKVMVRADAEHNDDQSRRQISLLVNQARTPAEASQVYQRISQVAKQFLGVNVLDGGHVLRDDAVPDAVRARTPLVLSFPKSNAARCMAQLAVRLGQGSPTGTPGGFFDRLGRWLFGA